MTLYCDCGNEMVLDEFEPDQDYCLASFHCEECGATASVNFAAGE